MSLDITTPFDVANGTDYETASGVIDSTEWDTLDLNITLNMTDNYGQYFMYLPAGVDFEPVNLRVRFQPGDGTLYIRWDIQTSVWGGFTTILSTTASYTLDDDVEIQITRNSSGVIATYVDGTLADSFTESSTITVGPGIVGINNTATNDLTVQSLSINAVSATNDFASTLAPATLVAAGNTTNTGTVASTLGPATLVAAGEAANTGTLTTTLSPATLSAAGNTANSGNVLTALGPATLSATGNSANYGNLAVTLAPATLAALGDVVNTGTLAVTLAPATLAGTGNMKGFGTFSTVLAPATLAASNSANNYGYDEHAILTNTVSRLIIREMR